MAGSLCPVELMKQVQEKMFMRVTSVYGLTETSPEMTATRIDDDFEVRCHTVGRDFEFTEVKVLDPRKQAKNVLWAYKVKCATADITI